MIDAVVIRPNVSNCTQINEEFVYYPNWIEAVWNSAKLNKAVWSSQIMNEAVWSYPKLMKMFHLAQIWMELLPFGQSSFSLLEFSQILQI